jgi:outer membrane protein OmpA-like peptidoglycan-associated protein/sugar lactone lactonase YvrE
VHQLSNIRLGAQVKDWRIRGLALTTICGLILVLSACGNDSQSNDQAPATSAPSVTAPTTAPAQPPDTTAPAGTPELLWSAQIDDVITRVNAIAVSPDGTLLAIGSAVTYLHHLADGELVGALVYRGTPADLVFSPDGALLAGGFNQGRVALSALDGSVPAGLDNLQRLEGYEGAYLAAGAFDTTVAFGPDGDTLVTSDRSGAIRVWSVSDGSLIREFEAPDAATRRSGVSLTTTVLEVNATGELVGAVDFDCNLQVWESATGVSVQSIDLNRIGCSLGRSFAFTAGGDQVAAAVETANTQVLRFWEARSGVVITDLPIGGRNVNGVSFSPDGSLVVTAVDTGAWSAPMIWDLDSGEMVFELSTPVATPSRVADVRFTPDSGHVIVGYSDGLIELWRLPGAEQLVAPERQICDPVPIPGDLLFDTGSAELRAEAGAVLSQLAQELASSFTQATLTFVGHTDSRGTAAANQELSLARARSVEVWFVAWASDNGITGWQLRVEGRGATQLRAVDFDPDGNFLSGVGALNRRVEIEIDAPTC